MRKMFSTRILACWLRSATRSPQLLLLALMGLFSTAGHAQTQTFPAGFSAVRVVQDIQSPTTMTFAPDGRIFICEQQGALRIVKDGKLLPTPFVNLNVFGTNGSPAGERGLIGVVVDPDFSNNHYVYVYYTLPTGANNRIVRFTANGDVAVKTILDLDPLVSATNHNGGAMHFGKDGKLYVAETFDISFYKGDMPFLTSFSLSQSMQVTTFAIFSLFSDEPASIRPLSLSKSAGRTNTAALVKLLVGLPSAWLCRTIADCQSESLNIFR